MLWRSILEEPNVANHPEDVEQSKRKKNAPHVLSHLNFIRV